MRPIAPRVLTAQGQLAQAEANIRSTQLQADRYRQLVAINGVSKQDADNAEAAAAQAKAAVVAQRGALKAAEVNLGFTRIRAPISGRIGRSLFTPGRAGPDRPGRRAGDHPADGPGLCRRHPVGGRPAQPARGDARRRRHPAGDRTARGCS